MGGREGGEGEGGVALELSHSADWSVVLRSVMIRTILLCWDLFHYFHKWEKQDPQDES